MDKAAVIRRVEYTYKKPNTRYDAEIGRHIGYKINVRVGGVRYREGCWPTRKAAQDYIDDLRLNNTYQRSGLKRRVKPSSITLKHLLEKRLADMPDDNRYSLVDRVVNYLLRITGPIKVTDLTYQHLTTFNKRRLADETKRGTPVTEHTVDREMTEISSMLKAAGDYFAELADYQPPKIPRLSLTDIRRERRISDSEKQLILDYYSRPQQPNESRKQYAERLMIGNAIEFAWLTGSRRKDVIKLLRSDYAPERDELRIIRWKTIKSKKQSISVFRPIPEKVKEVLDRQLALLRPDEQYIFSRDGKDKPGYLKSLKLACSRLNIPYGRFTKGGIILHDARHTFISTLIEDGIDIETTRDLAGVTREMALRYAHSSTASKRLAANTIDGSGHTPLREIFEQVRSGKMDFEQFQAALRKR